MRLHRIRVNPQGITIDGIPLTHSEEGPTIEPLSPSFYLVHLTVLADNIQLDGDRHYTPEATPIYDQLKEEERIRKGQQ
ncbi:hypothetical protein ACN4DT_03200 [Corynebacterium macclintockiae]|uniref:hypothetical protein n=1 Tax=Corynebacterium macclintockiae TaxID=2913501 RepID=UPI003EBF43F7